jgi:hypothetical protein
MGKRDSQVEDGELLPGTLRVAAAIGGAALAAGALAGGWSGWDSAPQPFVWLDVALAHFLSALPLAAVAVMLIRRSISPAACLGLAAAVAALAALGLAMFAAEPVEGDWVVNAAGRGAIALGGATAMLLATCAAVRAPPATGKGASHPWIVALLALTVLLVVPAVYVAARTRHDLGRLAGLLEQSRLFESRELARRLLALDPATRWQGQPLARVAADLDRTVRDLEVRTAAPLAESASGDERLARARDLAILDRTAAALEILGSPPSFADSPLAASLRGAIHEAKDGWQEALVAYGQAQRGWQMQPASPERTSGLAQAAAGIALCQRKLGNNRAAEAAYLEMLSLAPTADSHFLVARFYEDTQQAAQAQRHARRAMALDPDRYQVQGQKLIDKLVTLHFGCWGVFSAERDAAGSSWGGQQR